MKIGIIGAGYFGTAMAYVMGQKHEVQLIDRKTSKVQGINQYQKNLEVFPERNLPEKVSATDDIQTVQDLDMVFLAVSFRALPQIFQELKPLLPDSTIVINLSKGIDENTLLTAHQIFDGSQKFGTLHGPNFAKEIVHDDPTISLLASKDKEVLCKGSQVLEQTCFHLTTTDDIQGVELFGALKNVVALVAGIHDGLGWGENSRAALIVRGLQDICRLNMTLGGNKDTSLEIGTLGDLILSGVSPRSRNFQCGVYLGQGDNVETAKQKIGSTVEGISTVRAGYRLMHEHQLVLPVVKTAYDILYEDADPADTIHKFLRNYN